MSGSDTIIWTPKHAVRNAVPSMVAARIYYACPKCINDTYTDFNLAQVLTTSFAHCRGDHMVVVDLEYEIEQTVAAMKSYNLGNLSTLNLLFGTLFVKHKIFNQVRTKLPFMCFPQDIRIFFGPYRGQEISDDFEALQVLRFVVRQRAKCFQITRTKYSEYGSAVLHKACSYGYEKFGQACLALNNLCDKCHFVPCRCKEWERLGKLKRGICGANG